MDYEIITLKERITVGVSARTGNSSPDMSAVISGLWKKFYEGGVFEAISDKINGKSFGIYSDYASDKDGEYMVKAVGEFWQKLWTMDLDRSYICDFEEYRNSDMENAEIHMYIGLKD